MNRALGILATLAFLGAANAPSFGAGTESTPAAQQVDAYKKAVDLIDDEKFTDAIPFLETSMRERGEYADALNLMGYSYRMSGKWKLGKSYYLKALALEPNHLGANQYLGELYVEQKDLAMAEERLAVLKAACGSCDEYEDLLDVIEDFRAETASN
jgi:tetratricopeptide (TPR) repeat protein